MKRTFSENKDYKLIIEMEQCMLFLHISVFNWGKSVLKSIRNDMDEVLRLTKEQGWDEIYAYTKNVKFANLVEPCEIVAPMEGREDITIVKWITG